MKALALIMCVFAPDVCSAQNIVSSFSELRTFVKPGDTVYVADEYDEETKGRVEDLSDSTLVLLVGRKDDRRTFAPGSIRKVARGDSLFNGLLIGLAAGWASGYAMVRAACGPPGYDDECAVNTGIILYPLGLGVGAAAGEIMDHMIRRTIYLGGTGSVPVDLSVAPMASWRRRGAFVTLRF